MGILAHAQRVFQVADMRILLAHLLLAPSQITLGGVQQAVHMFSLVRLERQPLLLPAAVLHPHIRLRQRGVQVAPHMLLAPP